MKNLDIEKLERKNIYKTPDDFFEKIQANVLNEVTQQSKTELKQTPKTTKLNWWYAAAASVVLIFGATFLYNNSTNTVEDIANVENSIKPTTNSTTTIVTEENTKPATENYVTLVNDIKEVADSEKTKKATQKIVLANNNQPKKTVKTTTKVDEQMEQILEAFTAEDIVALSKNTEQDVYLDLYN